jgi:hypothetical protein
MYAIYTYQYYLQVIVFYNYYIVRETNVSITTDVIFSISIVSCFNVPPKSFS